MDRFEAAKWMVEHPGQRMVDSDGDEWWWDKSLEDFQINGKPGSLFVICIADVTFSHKRDPIKSYRRRAYPAVDRDGPYIRIPKRFARELIEVRVKVCDD